MCGEFPIESEYSSIALEAAKDSAVEVVNKHDCFPVMTEAGIQELKEGQLYDLPKGWTVEIEDTCKWHGNRDVCGNEICWDLQECQKSPSVKIARLILLKEQENLIASQIPYPEPTGIAAIGLPDYGKGWEGEKFSLLKDQETTASDRTNWQIESHKKCPKCGSRNPITFKMCVNCDHRFNAVPPPPQAESQEILNILNGSGSAQERLFEIRELVEGRLKI